jgi:hypothetical protein
LGSKRKFWFRRKEDPQPWLFKYVRPGTGEHWAEKVASELARAIGVDAARVELAHFEEDKGAAVESIVPHLMDPYAQAQAKLWEKRTAEAAARTAQAAADAAREPSSVVEAVKWAVAASASADAAEKWILASHLRLGDLIHGNELLAGRLPNYDKDKKRGQFEHSWSNIKIALEGAFSADRLEKQIERFAGLLVLDALIGNTDRHHENWALLLHHSSPKGESAIPLELAPSYDHASSLGREMTDEKRAQILSRGGVADYARRGRGAIFLQKRARHGENPAALVKYLVRELPEAFRPWLERLRTLTEDSLLAPVWRIPPDWASDISKQFCAEFLRCTLSELKRIDA